MYIDQSLSPLRPAHPPRCIRPRLRCLPLALEAARLPVCLHPHRLCHYYCRLLTERTLKIVSFAYSVDRQPRPRCTTQYPGFPPLSPPPLVHPQFTTDSPLTSPLLPFLPPSFPLQSSIRSTHERERVFRVIRCSTHIFSLFVLSTCDAAPSPYTPPHASPPVHPPSQPLSPSPPSLPLFRLDFPSSPPPSSSLPVTLFRCASTCPQCKRRSSRFVETDTSLHFIFIPLMCVLSTLCLYHK
ncbi:hypothetical protein R3P38DRAFT_3068952 [Favolaschia claudopus]|uniref:Uncharacterized protein n=1 Tax=Favolaschia claudopus TaxID=2862362 RepID=A0AAW0A0F6_9AGAR